VPDVPVRVEVERSGGFAGLVTHSEADTANLPPPDADELRRLVADVDLAGLTGRTSAGGPRTARGADRFQYDVTVQAGSQTYQFTVYDGAIPPELQPLLSYVTRRRQDI
jgi:hypothetical protein